MLLSDDISLFMRVLIRFIANSIKAASSPAIFPVFQFLMNFLCLGIGCASFGHSWWVELSLCFDHRMSTIFSKIDSSRKLILQENWFFMKNKNKRHLTGTQEAIFRRLQEQPACWRSRDDVLQGWLMIREYWNNFTTSMWVDGLFRRNLFMVFRGFSGGLLWKV